MVRIAKMLFKFVMAGKSAKYFKNEHITLLNIYNMIFVDLRKSQGLWEQREGGIVPQEGNQMWDQHVSLTKQ